MWACHDNEAVGGGAQWQGRWVVAVVGGRWVGGWVGDLLCVVTGCMQAVVEVPALFTEGWQWTVNCTGKAGHRQAPISPPGRAPQGRPGRPPAHRGHA